MLKFGNTLHFINRVDDSNCGDWLASPLLYYYDYFKRYHIKRHDMRCIDFESISSSDVVIIGGGGMFDYAEFANRAINRVLDSGAAVIAWAPGLNTHLEYAGTYTTRIRFQEFAAVTVRDFQNEYGLPYLPDITCKLPGLKQDYTIRRKFGIARHKDYPIEGMDYDTITNAAEIDEILRFIGETEIVISNSFHMIYWATLMGKKTICANPFSSKFFTYRYPPVYFTEGADTLAECAEKAVQYQILDECIEANDAFFARVKEIIESRLTPVSDYWSVYDYATEVVQQRQLNEGNQFAAGNMLSSQLYIDDGQGFREERKLIAINNVLGDDMHTVRFDLNKFEMIQALRFDPIEGRNCEIEILSARTDQGDVVLNAYASVRTGKSDRFLTTDPQYFITAPGAKYIEIQFKLRLLSHSEAERNIILYAERASNDLKNIEAKLEAVYQSKNNIEAKLEEVYQSKKNIEAKLEEVYQSKSWRLTAPLRAISDFVKRLLKGMW